MESKLSAKGTKILSHTVTSLFAVITLLLFLISIDKTAFVTITSIAMIALSLYLMWKYQENDSVSLLIFFFGTTACFYFFSDIIVSNFAKTLSILAFAAISLILTNYLLNPIKTATVANKGLYKISLALLFSEIFWVLSFISSSPISKGAITAVVFFNFLTIARDTLSSEFNRNKFAFYMILSIILLMIVIYRI